MIVQTFKLAPVTVDWAFAWVIPTTLGTVISFRFEVIVVVFGELSNVPSLTMSWTTYSPAMSGTNPGLIMEGVSRVEPLATGFEKIDQK